MRESVFDILIRRWPVLLAGLILGAAAGVILDLTGSPSYTASATAIVTSSRPGAGDTTDAGVPIAEAYSRLADDPPVVSDAVAISGVKVDAGKVRKIVRASASPDVPIVEIFATRADPIDAARLADGVVQALTAQSNKASGTLGFVLRPFAPASTPTARSDPGALFQGVVGGALGLLLGGLLAFLLPGWPRRLRPLYRSQFTDPREAFPLEADDPGRRVN